MELTLEGLIVAIVAILPGFLSDAVRVQLDADRKSSAGEWVAGSIVTSLFLNAAALGAFLFWSNDLDLKKTIKEFVPQLDSVPAWHALQYLAALYVFAVLWGAFLGWLHAQYFQGKLLGYRLRLTSVSGESTVLMDVLADLVRTRENLRLRGKPEQLVPWLRVRRPDVVVLGRMRQSSTDFELTDPFEVYFSPAYVFKNGSSLVQEPANPFQEYVQGLHLRVRPKDLVEVLVAPTHWDPASATPQPDRRGPLPGQAPEETAPRAGIRRDFLVLATSSVASVGAALTLWPFIGQMNPDAVTSPSPRRSS